MHQHFSSFQLFLGCGHSGFEFNVKVFGWRSTASCRRPWRRASFVALWFRPGGRAWVLFLAEWATWAVALTCAGLHLPFGFGLPTSSSSSGATLKLAAAHRHVVAAWLCLWRRLLASPLRPAGWSPVLEGWDILLDRWQLHKFCHHDCCKLTLPSSQTQAYKRGWLASLSTTPWSVHASG